MHFYNIIKELSEDKKLDIFVDMDGVIASYDFGNPLNFKAKRPLNTNIKLFENISKLENINLYILSVCKKDFQIKEKNDWLDKYAPFFKKDNRNILSKETYTKKTSPELKAEFLYKFKTRNQKVVVDDDNEVLKEVARLNTDIILYQDSELID